MSRKLIQDHFSARNAGLISGNTAATGTFSFTVQATDIEYLTATAALSLTVTTGGGGGGSGGSSISWTTFTYDGIGRTLSVTQPDGASTTHYSYSGNQTTVTDPAGNGKTFTSDVEGNLTTVVEPDPANAPSGTLTTSYTYDWMNHVSQVAMTRGATTQTRTFVYNDAGLLTSATNPENGTVSYTYNADNTLLYKHDAKGQDTVYSYDSKQRVTYVRRYPTGRNNAEDTCQAVAYFYDTNPFAYSSSAGGRLAATTYYAGNCAAGVGQSMVEMYSYHPAGGVTVKSVQAGTSAAQTVYYVYNAAGQVTTMTYPTPTSAVLTYGYDGMDRLNSLSSPGAPWNWAQNVQYDVAGRMSGIQYPAGAGAVAQETMTYNVNGQLASLNWTGSGPVGGIQYNYSGTQNNGQITQAVDTLSGETIGYQYDSLKRLTSASSTPIGGSSTTPWMQTYQYDGFGNLTAKVLNGTTTPIAVNPVANQLSNAYYDGNGNMTSGLGATLTYDVSNRLASAAETSGGIEYYGYAPDNKRVFRQLANGHQQITLYGAGGEKLSVYDLTANTAVSTYVWFGGKLISDGNPVFQDRLGTNRASGGSTTTNNGARFLPYGEEITSTANDHVKFGTYNRDSYTGLDYADQRFYASTYGRFNTPDPFGGSAHLRIPGSWNRYSYCQDDPVDCNDPTGLVDWHRVVLGVGQVGLGVAGVVGSATATAGTLGASLPATIFTTIVGAGAIAGGFTNIIAGATEPGSRVSPGVELGIETAGRISSPGGLLAGVLSGGNKTAVQAGAAASSAVSVALDLNDVINSLNSPGQLATSLASVASDLQDFGNALPQGPVVGPSTTIQISDSQNAVPYDPSPISMPEVLTIGGGGGPFGAYAAPDEEDPF